MLAGVFDLFKIGIGPSSSHTVGPMKAANAFARTTVGPGRIRVTLFGSLAWTGRGHATDKAITLGLAGEEPQTVDVDSADARFAEIAAARRIGEIEFDPVQDIVFDTKTLYEFHPNAMCFEAFNPVGARIRSEVWFSIGGGFIVREGETASEPKGAADFHYANGHELLALGRSLHKRISDIALANELTVKSRTALDLGIDRIAQAMFDCIDRGLSRDGYLPGALHVRRRAKSIYERITASGAAAHNVMDHVSAFAIAVNEENAAGGRVVTAPTNGAAGVFPAVLRYYRDFCPGATADGIREFFLAATGIGAIIKRNASISGAEIGCQGEVGSAAAMAAAGLAAALGATNEQVENAAEIAIEHHLGMTCDPVGGLVQIPCIERNAFGAVKAIQAASLAMLGDGRHHVTLDQAIETMRQTGMDMQTKYKETSRGGLALNVIEC